MIRAVLFLFTELGIFFTTTSAGNVLSFEGI
jgi:hypothetical protein